MVRTCLFLAVKLHLLSRGVTQVEVRAETLLLGAALGVDAVQASVSVVRGHLLILATVSARSARLRDLCKFQRLR